MKQIFNKLTIAIFGLTVFFATTAKAQVATGYRFSSSQGTYTEITGDSVVFTNQKNSMTTAVPIGFTANINGYDITKVLIYTNGWITDDSSTITSEIISNPLVLNETFARKFVLAPFARFLEPQAGSEVCYQTIGTAPNRVFVVQYKNQKRWTVSIPPYGDSTINFQVRIYETSNKIEFVYGNFITIHPSVYTGVAVVGVGGTTNTDYQNRKTTTNWAATTAANTHVAMMSFSSTIKPANGLTYTFSPIPQTPTVNMSRYITLTVTQGDSIQLDIGTDENDNAKWVKVVSGTMEKTLAIGPSRSGIKNYYAEGQTMTIYGDVETLNCWNNTSHITGIDVSHNRALRELLCPKNSITSLDASGLTQLKTLHCWGNPLTSLVINGLTQLEELNCSDDSLTSLDASGLTQLKELNCYNNSLTSLNVSGLEQLNFLLCAGNNFTTEALDYIYCALPQKDTAADAVIFPIDDSTSSYNDTVMATNKTNATAKNWKVKYLSNYRDITTSGNFDCSNVGIEAVSAEKTTRIYPNPVSDVLTIESSETIETLQLFDLAGKLLLSQMPKNKMQTIDVSAFQNGVYILKISGKNGRSVKKVVIAN